MVNPSKAERRAAVNGANAGTVTVHGHLRCLPRVDNSDVQGVVNSTNS